MVSDDMVWKTTESGYELFREPVIAFVVHTELRRIDDSNRGLKEVSPWLQPITLNTMASGSGPLDSGLESFQVESRDDFEIIPAPDETYKVSTDVEGGEYTILGYDYPGASTPDWDAICKRHGEPLDKDVSE